MIKFVDKWILLFVGRTRRITQYSAERNAPPYSRTSRVRTMQGCEAIVRTKMVARGGSRLSPQNKKAPLRVPFVLVETSGLEPLTPCMSSKYSNQLSYASKLFTSVLYTIIRALSRLKYKREECFFKTLHCFELHARFLKKLLMRRAIFFYFPEKQPTIL